MTTPLRPSDPTGVHRQELDHCERMYSQCLKGSSFQQHFQSIPDPEFEREDQNTRAVQSVGQGNVCKRKLKKCFDETQK